MTATAEAPADEQLELDEQVPVDPPVDPPEEPEPPEPPEPPEAPAQVVRKATAPRRAARPRPAPPEPAAAQPDPAAVNGGLESAVAPTVQLQAPDAPRGHPIYGDKKLYTYQPRDGSAPIVFPHITNARPTPKFFYKNRKKDEMHQAFAWMDLCEIPDEIGERLFDLPGEEQSIVMSEWFGGLNLSPQGVGPPGES